MQVYILTQKYSDSQARLQLLRLIQKKEDYLHVQLWEDRGTIKENTKNTEKQKKRIRIRITRCKLLV